MARKAPTQAAEVPEETSIETPEVESPPATPSGPSPETPSGFSLRDKLAESGYNIEPFADDEAAYKAMLATADAYSGIKDDLQFIDYGKRFAPHADKWEQFQEWLGSQQGQPQPEPAKPQQQAADQAFKWEAPEFDQTWLNRCTWDAERNAFLARDASAYPIAEKLNNYAQWRQQTEDRLLREFPTLAKQALQSEFEAIRKEVADFKASFAQREEAEVQQQWIASHKEAFYGQDGKPTALATAVAQHAAELEQAGITGPMALKLLDQFVEYQQLKGGVAPTLSKANGASPAEVQEKKQGEFLEKVVRGQRTASRAGTIPTGTKKERGIQNPSDLASVFDQEAEAAGVSLRR